MALHVSELVHVLMIRSVALALAKAGYGDVRADLSGFRRPEAAGSGEGGAHVPDVTAFGTRLHVFEVETPDSIGDAHTGAEWRALAQHAEAHGGSFWVVVPRGEGPKAQRRLDRLGLDGRALELSGSRLLGGPADRAGAPVEGRPAARTPRGWAPAPSIRVPAAYASSGAASSVG